MHHCSGLVQEPSSLERIQAVLADTTQLTLGSVELYHGAAGLHSFLKESLVAECQLKMAGTFECKLDVQLVLHITVICEYWAVYA